MCIRDRYMSLCLASEKGDDLEGFRLENVSFEDW